MAGFSSINRVFATPVWSTSVFYKVMSRRRIDSKAQNQSTRTMDHGTQNAYKLGQRVGCDPVSVVV